MMGAEGSAHTPSEHADFAAGPDWEKSATAGAESAFSEDSFPEDGLVGEISGAKDGAGGGLSSPQDANLDEGPDEGLKDEEQNASSERAAYDRALRPRVFREFTGQRAVQEQLHILVEAALQRDEPVDHLLFCGPPGLGKTTLAHIVAAESGVMMRQTSGPALERPGDLAAIVTSLDAGDILFVDEIHRLSRQVEEVLYPAMEDYAVDIVVGKGPTARTIRLDLPPFTLIGATTRAGLLTSPLRDRFGYVGRLEFYEPPQLAEIVLRSASILDVEVTTGAATQIACRARGTPRVANRLLRRVRDYAQVRACGKIDERVAREGLDLFGIDTSGLDAMDRELLRTLITVYGGGPVGVATLAVSLGEEPGTVEDVIEPFLLQRGFLVRTQRGRTATPAAYKLLHVDLPVEEGPQFRL